MECEQICLMHEGLGFHDNSKDSVYNWLFTMIINVKTLQDLLGLASKSTNV